MKIVHVHFKITHARRIIIKKRGSSMSINGIQIINGMQIIFDKMLDKYFKSNPLSEEEKLIIKELNENYTY